MDRRQFFKFSALTGSSATLASCGNPETQLIRFIPDERLDPGVAVWKPSICTLCSAGCGMSVRVMKGEVEVVRDGQAGIMEKALAKKLEGLPEHPVSRGALCARGQAGIQATYHPDRLAGPMRRVGDRGSGLYEPVSWDEAMGQFVDVLDELIASDRRAALACLTRPLGGQRNRVLGEFLSGFGAPPPVTFEVFGEGVLREANRRSFGIAQMPTIDLGGSRYIVVLGADLLGTWNSPVAQNRGYGTMRQGRPGIRGKLVQVESRMSPTGAKADEWVPARAGTEGALVLGLAHVIMAAGLRSANDASVAGRWIEGWGDGLPGFTPERVSEITGVAAERVERLGLEFAEHRPAVAVAGGASLAHSNGLFTALAVNALNALVGSVGVEGGVVFTPQTHAAPTSETSGIREFAESLLGTEAPNVDALIVNDANPVFGTPLAWRIEEALSRIGFIVSFGSFLDETSALADLILPDHSSLESWLDHVPESGTTDDVWTITPPVMRPLHDTRAMPDVVLELARTVSDPVEGLARFESFEAVLEASSSDLPMSWIRIRERGGWWEPAASVASLSGTAPAPLPYTDPSFDGDPDEFAFHLVPYPSQSFYDGSLAHLPWLQELPDVLTSAMWSNWVEINPRTADELGIRDGDMLEVTSAHGSVLAPALIYPGIAPDTLGMPVGQGHVRFTRYASGRGSNPLAILAPVVEETTGSLAWAATRVRIARTGEDGNLILFGGALREHEEETR